ncbi:uncharacterized protein BO80DRAFT_454045 [Aspergillus ibericus CBS 121593]|uniref:Uncharacterized protein n=1 Tax=Aspergillus ibericus CBS 121593 TaxID=1448316 RepID=A0A395H389_9EURO|nr:hypothetical protein BO80DRAFT_454045 [Aspergillus ibericus CBS 121593]RAL02351.1 hypothetical protein BO80DRAFT_454045 [Aspergillus ibericus CBS 121593]
MPIPTRSLSLREPRKQSSTAGRATAGKPAPTTSTAATGTTSTAATGNENLPRGKSLLPIRDDARVTRSSRPQQQPENRTSQRASKPSEKGQQSAQETTGIARRQSLIRPSPLKPSVPLKPTISSTVSRRTNVAPGPSSPVKQEIASKQYGRPLSPKKTDMPPPPRMVRSASLRQLAASSSSTPSVTRGHTRHRSQGITLAPSQTSRKVEPPSPSPTATPRSRAQFTTYQQAFSPKKSAKPATAAPLTDASAVDTDSSLIPSSWPEVAALQTELLQLSLVHLSSSQQHVEWEGNAEAQLRIEYDSVASDYRAALSEEKGYQTQLNGQALHYWLENSRERNGQQSFTEQVRVLSQVAEEVYDLSDSLGGRYAVIVQEFEAWFQGVEDIRTQRLRPDRALDEVVFIDPLNQTWRNEASALVMKLELCLRQLQSLDILGYGEAGDLGGSALFRTATRLEEMANMMIEELNTIRKIESDVVKSERVWVSQLARQLTAVSAHDQRRPRVGMWKQSLLHS